MGRGGRGEEMHMKVPFEDILERIESEEVSSGVCEKETWRGGGNKSKEWKKVGMRGDSSTADVHVFGMFLGFGRRHCVYGAVVIC
jgi:hypothetical protein